MLLSHGGEHPRTAAPAVRWTVEQVLALAPDEASCEAGSGLGAAGAWSGGGYDGSGAVWGLCAGSGSDPYRTVVDTTGPAYRCGCPGRRSPCEHALGLLLVWAAGERALAAGEPPDWAEEWLTGRRGRAAEEKGAAGKDAEGKSTAGMGGVGGAPASGAPASGPADPEAARRRAVRRAERISGGAQELEQRLADLLRGGLAAADQPGYGLWEETAARMVDAQAPGLAARVRELGALSASGPGWPVRLLEECALLHLLDRAWLGIDRLPEPLAATVRTRVGLTAPADGPPVRDHWLVLAQYDTPDGRIVTRRVWLYGRRSGRTALLLSFGAAGRAPGTSLPVGATIDAEVTPYPGGGRLRVELGQRFGDPSPGGTPPPGGSTAAALSAYGDALRDDPWLDAWPTTLRAVIPVPSGDGWQLVDAAGEGALPVAPSAPARPGLWKLAALSGGLPVTVFGECGHRGFDPLAAWPAPMKAYGDEQGEGYAEGAAGTATIPERRTAAVRGGTVDGGTAERGEATRGGEAEGGVRAAPGATRTAGAHAGAGDGTEAGASASDGTEAGASASDGDGVDGPGRRRAGGADADDACGPVGTARSGAARSGTTPEIVPLI